MTRTLTLTHPDLDPFTIGGPGNRIDLLDLELGHPRPRTVRRDRPGRHGTIDTTRLVGERLVSMLLWFDDVDWDTEQRLREFTAPDIRPRLQLVEPGAPLRELAVYAKRWGDPRSAAQVHARSKVVTIHWIAPAGVITSVEPQSATIFPGSSDEVGGIEFDWEFDLEFPAGSPPGAGLVENLGNFWAVPVLRVFGPCGPDEIVLRNNSTDREIVLDGLEILDGEFVEIDVDAATVLLNGRPHESRFDFLDFERLDWWTLRPRRRGVNDIWFRPETFGSGARLEVRWSHTWI